MSQNQNKRTLRTIGLVVAVTLLTKILGIVREALQAGVFGTQTAFDLYTISYNYTIYIFTTVAYALCIAAVPVISRHLAEDRNKAFAVAGNLICVSVLVSAVIGVHRSRVNIEIGVELHNRYAVAPCFQQPAQCGGGDAFAQRGNYAPGNENQLGVHVFLLNIKSSMHRRRNAENTPRRCGTQ